MLSDPIWYLSTRATWLQRSKMIVIHVVQSSIPPITLTFDSNPAHAWRLSRICASLVVALLSDTTTAGAAHVPVELLVSEITSVIVPCHPSSARSKAQRALLKQVVPATVGLHRPMGPISRLHTAGLNFCPVSFAAVGPWPEGFASSAAPVTRHASATTCRADIEPRKRIERSLVAWLPRHTRRAAFFAQATGLAAASVRLQHAVTSEKKNTKVQQACLRHHVGVLHHLLRLQSCI